MPAPDQHRGELAYSRLRMPRIREMSDFVLPEVDDPLLRVAECPLNPLEHGPVLDPVLFPLHDPTHVQFAPPPL